MDKSKRIIGARIRIKPEFSDLVGNIFQTKGILPIRQIKRDDGDITFEIEVLDGKSQFELLESIPKEAFALNAVLKID